MNFFIKVIIWIFFISQFAMAPLARAHRDPLTSFCNSIVDSVLKRVKSSKVRPFGIKPFESEIRLILEKHIPRGVPELTSDYMEHAYQEWALLGDPAFHLSVLKYPIPEAAIAVLASAVDHQVSSAQISNLIEQGRIKGSQKEVLIWVQRILEHPEKKWGNLLNSFAKEYGNSVVISRERLRYLTGIPLLPEVRPGHVRMYKGSNFYKGPAVSQSQVGKPLSEIGDGGLVFMDQSDANTHSIKAEAFHPDGVSVSTDKTVPINYGSHIRIYDVPIEVVAHLPRGAPGLNEYVFKYSVPERFRVKTLPKATYLEVLKQESLRASSYGDLARAFARDSGFRLMGLLHGWSDPILIRGRSLTFSGLMNERLPAFEMRSIEHQTLRGLEQFEKYTNHFHWSVIRVPPNVDLRSTVNFSFTLRHLGKPLAESFDLSHSLVSAEILGQMMRKAGYSKSEVDLGQALVGNDVIGAMIRGEMSSQEAFEELVLISKRTNLSPRDFFRIQSFLYSMDASSSSDLAALFIKEGELLVPKSDRFRVLRNLFENVEISN